MKTGAFHITSILPLQGNQGVSAVATAFQEVCCLRLFLSDSDLMGVAKHGISELDLQTKMNYIIQQLSDFRKEIQQLISDPGSLPTPLGSRITELLKTALPRAGGADSNNVARHQPSHPASRDQNSPQKKMSRAKPAELMTNICILNGEDTQEVPK